MSKPTMGSLFAGGGGFDLGFERAGFETVWQVEIDPFCRKVLAKNFPNAERFEDVRTVGQHNLRRVDVVCGGPPCQPASIAGLRKGAEDDRWMWPDTIRIVGELRPKYALLENPTGIFTSGFGDILAQLSCIGYDAEWRVISAAYVGLGHVRKRVWILAYPMRERFEGHQPRVSFFEPAKETFAQHRYSSAQRREAVDDFAAGLPEIDGLSVGLVRKCVRALGNAVVPQIPEMYARRIKQLLESEC
jgi:DNA (cytosine-5)-methyltransferase 1